MAVLLSGPSVQVPPIGCAKPSGKIRASVPPCLQPTTNACFFSGFPAVLCAPALKLSFYLWKAVDDPHACVAAALQTERTTQALSARTSTAAEGTC